MKTALIGHRGLVGSRLLQHFEFDSLYNSEDIETIRNKAFSLMVCTGTPGDMKQVNSNPAADRETIETLIDCLGNVQAEFTILISTSDVFADPNNVDEDDRPTKEGLHPYGLHRLMLEEFFRTHFNKVCIVRLPTLFGEGLKENIIYDLISENHLDEINIHSTFQYYNLANLWRDLQIVRRYELSPAHFATEPIMTADIVRYFFPDLKVGAHPGPETHYDILSRHAEYFNGKTPYLYSVEQVMSELAEFLPISQEA